LPVVGGAVDGEVIFLPFGEEELFRVWMGKGSGKVGELFTIRKGGEKSPAWETRPLDGVSVKVDVM